jgi:tetraacyldisaccharide 4'-kinase
VYFAARILRDRRYLKRFQERLGFLPHELQQPLAGAIWLHAVSVGEVLSTIGLLRLLRARLPSTRLFVSTSTLAGRALAEEKLRGLADGVFWAPIDYCFAVRRILRTLRPSVVVVAETEIWPNLYREAKRGGCNLVIVNGRISDNAEPRYRRLAGFFKCVLEHPDAILAQSDVSRRRYLALGAPARNVVNAGNLKYDFQPGQAAIPAEIAALVERARPREIWIAASTMPPAAAGDVDEDDAVIDAFRGLAPAHPGLLLVLAPRKPERFDAVAEKLRASGLTFVRRSQLGSGADLPALPGVLLVDSIGELGSLFALDSVVFMGGSLARRGGHNILEPALYGRPVIAGPHMENFAEIASEFQAGGGCLSIEGPKQLSSAVDRLLRETGFAAQTGLAARRLAEAKRGATERAASAIADWHARALPRFLPVFPLRPLLWLLSRVWQRGGGWKRRRDQARIQRLRTPVVSVGGLSMGGSGKTPFVLWLAARCREDGLKPAILTRGYRRRSPEAVTILDAGVSAPVARTGDEGQILARSGVAPVGIGADRAAAGRALEGRFHPDLFILDDGFQHHRLARELDIVLVDALDPLGGGDVFPRGRLREAPPALSRAGAFVITRAERGRAYTGIEAALRAHNREAPIFTARVVPEYWVEYDSRQQFAVAELPCFRVAAFCGLANPGSFWATLAGLGCRPLARWGFGDHHRYRPLELHRVAAAARRLGAEILLTTEKDAMNLCREASKHVAPLRLCWLKIGLEVDGERDLLGIVERLLTIH